MSLKKNPEDAVLGMLKPLPGGLQASAQAAVGADDLSRLAWLLELLNRPAETFLTMSERERLQLESEVAVFCQPIGSITGGQTSQLHASTAQDMIGDLRWRIFAMLEGSTFELEIPRVTLLVIPNSGLRYMGEPIGIFRLAVARLIEAEGHRIKRCARPGCGRLFVHRKRALYCGRRCSQIEQFQRYLDRHSR